MLRYCTFSCICAHTSCYATVRSHALACTDTCDGHDDGDDGYDDGDDDYDDDDDDDDDENATDAKVSFFSVLWSPL